jgi:iron complex outermembrane recepter protein
MKSNPKISAAVAAILSAPATTLVVAAPADTAAATGGELTEVIVTANRREENLQNVPITIQALTSDTIKQLNVQTFDDFVKYLPNVTQGGGGGPGQSNIYMRGLATSLGAIQGAGVIGSFPNVAIYLDEQSGQVPQRNLDIYAADLERIEVLEGPQGTLFGAGAEAGVVRYITNKPKLDRVEANFNASYATTASGDPSTAIDAVLNVPLISNQLAARVVIYNDRRGGYIDNQAATFARAPADRVVTGYFGGVVPPNSGPINNYALAEQNFNPVTYNGIRASLLWQFNENWNAQLTQSYQNMEADGVFWQEAFDGTGKTLPELTVQQFNPNSNKDRFSNTALVVNGNFNDWHLVYAGSYLNRHVDQVADYTNYSRGTYAGYYQCNYPGYPFHHNPVTGKNDPTPNSPGYCYSPSAFWTDKQQTTHQSHELRLTSPVEYRLRGIVGAFWEKYEIHENVDWHYGTSPNFTPVGPPTIDPGNPTQTLPASANNPDVRPLGDSFFDDISRGYKQTALFTSIDFDLIPKKLTITGGTRWYKTDNFERGSNVGSFGCEIFGPYNGVSPPNPCVSTVATGVISNLNNLDAKNLDNTDKGFRSRANLTWHITDEALVYYTWSQGFRPGGFNRAASIIAPGSPIYGLFTPPLSYAPDTLTNNEVGWKTEWWNRRLQFNGAVYQEDWKNTQIAIFDPGVTGNLTFTTNGPDYRVRGVEITFAGRVAEGLTVTGGAAWNSSEVVKTLSLTNPATGQPINIVNPFGELGTPLAHSPPFEGNLRARYDFQMGDYGAFGQLGVTHQSHSLSSTDYLTQTLQGQSTVFDLPAYTMWDMQVGVSKGDWTAVAFCENLTDERAIMDANYRQWVKAEVVSRPRTIGLKLSYYFREK